MGDPVLVLRLGKDDDPNVPERVNGHLDARTSYEASPFNIRRLDVRRSLVLV